MESVERVRPERLITTAETGALFVATAGDLIAQGPERTLPRPRVIVGILVFYGLLGLAAGLGEGIARFAGATAVVTFLVTLVGTGAKGTGAAGKGLIAFIQKTTELVTGPQGGEA